MTLVRSDDPHVAARTGVQQSTVAGSQRGRARWTLTLVCSAVFMLMLDMTIVAAALPRMQSTFGASLSGLQWGGRRL